MAASDEVLTAVAKVLPGTATTNGDLAPTPSFEMADVRGHTTEKDCWLVVHGKVYDVTDFLEEHPGGYDIILTVAGKDATVEFEEIGHSKAARKMLDQFVIGEFKGGDAIPQAPAPSQIPSKKASTPAPSALTRAFHVLLPILLALTAVLIHLYQKSK